MVICSLLHLSATHVVVSKNEQFVDPVHEVSLDSPIQLYQHYGNNRYEQLIKVSILGN